MIGLWGDTEGTTKSAKRLRDSGADEVVFSLADAMVQIAKLAPATLEPMSAAPIPSDDDNRLAALRELQLLDSDAEPVFDRITSKLAWVLRGADRLDLACRSRPALFQKPNRSTGRPRPFTEGTSRRIRVRIRRGEKRNHSD